MPKPNPFAKFQKKAKTKAKGKDDKKSKEKNLPPWLKKGKGK